MEAVPKLTQLGATLLVTQREIRSRLKSKTFLVSTAVLLTLVLGMVVLMTTMNKPGGLSGPVSLVTTQEAKQAAPHEMSDAQIVSSAEDAIRAVTEGDADVAVIPDSSSPTGLQLVGKESIPYEVNFQFAAHSTTRVLSPPDVSPMALQMISFVFGLIYTWSVISFGSTIAQSVVEEKQTRVVEIVLSTISSRALLFGKVLGNTVLALMTVVFALLFAATGLKLTHTSIPAGGIALAGLWFAALFLFGFILIATCYALIASFVSRVEDLGSVTAPITMILMLPYMLVMLMGDNPTVLAYLSYIPFSAPVGMPARLYGGSAEPFEPLIALLIQLVSIIVFMILASRTYQRGVMQFRRNQAIGLFRVRTRTLESAT